MIEIVDYHPTWPAEYAAIAAPLAQALGNLAMRMDHIGSTAVPGMAAKDIIDVQISVRNFDPPLEERLASLGYTLDPTINSDHQPSSDRGSAVEWEKRYFRPPTGQRPTHLHVRILGRANVRYSLLFRDYLRAKPGAAAAYAELKRRLARLAGDDRVAYTATKDPVCDLIMVAAEAWAKGTYWMQ